ncbi:MAG TPA: N-acetyltransferase [Acidobacteriota bacterium]|nr:N-acetyltransferase [Acidobacteriota bacterium]HQF88784.1 N-acetyltransferase [Acidobacteriota bacterium]HQG91189.1 N-acetyltransferase [Acidobacteriota bacterium]HQK87291.1 N-acetyltransferase [Acidobacteriota bacterium]
MSSSSSLPRLVPLFEIGSAQLAPVLEAERAEWAASLDWDFEPALASLRYMLDNRVLPGVAVAVGDRGVGYAYYLFRDQRALVGGLYFLPEFRDGDWPRLVLQRVFQELARQPLARSIEGQILFPGPERSAGPLLRASGFQFLERRFLRLEAPAEHPLPPAPADLTLRPIPEGMLDDLALVMTHAYHGHVDARTSSLYLSFDGCARLLQALVLRGGCGPCEASLSLMVAVRDTPAGAIVVSRISKGSFFISQVFVHPRYQGQGIGRVLVGAVVNALARRHPGAGLSLTVSRDNTRAYDWYRRLGFADRLPHYAFMKLAGD